VIEHLTGVVADLAGRWDKWIVRKSESHRQSLSQSTTGL
jgi:hypothetical protein